MPMNPVFKVIGAADIVRLIVAEEDVDVVGVVLAFKLTAYS